MFHSTLGSRVIKKKKKGRLWEFQNATFRFVVLNECVGPGNTTLHAIITSGLLLRISDPGAKFKIRRVSDNPTGDLAWLPFQKMTESVSRFMLCQLLGAACQSG